MYRRLSIASLLVLALALLPWPPVPAFAAGAPDGTDVTGRVLDVQGGLPVPGATIELRKNEAPVARAVTDGAGN